MFCCLESGETISTSELSSVDVDSVEVVSEHSEESECQTRASLRLLTFNLWCPYYKSERRDDTELEADRQLALWTEMQKASKHADVYCLQEFWCANEAYMSLWRGFATEKGYALDYLKRTSPRKPDGVCSMHRAADAIDAELSTGSSRFRLISTEKVQFRSSNRIALISVFEWTLPKKIHKTDGISHEIKSDESKEMEEDCAERRSDSELKAPTIRVAVANTHLTFPSGPWDVGIRERDTRQLLQAFGETPAKAKSSYDFEAQCDLIAKYRRLEWSMAAAASESAQCFVAKVICGDFNCEYADANAKQVYACGYQSVAKRLATDGFVSHLNHEQTQSGCDLVFVKAPKQRIGHWQLCAKVKDAFVHPRDLSCAEWPADHWHCSDHRPVAALFDFELSKTEL